MLDIILIVVGAALIIVSFLVSSKIDAKKEEKEAAQIEIWTQKDEEMVREQTRAIVLKETEEAMVKTDEQLAEISNEKIMQISEFTDQILEKIKQNHTEVVFLYDMLNEKDESLKALLQELAETTRRSEKVLDSMHEMIKKQEQLRKNVRTQTAINKTVSEKSTKVKTAVDLLEENKRLKENNGKSTAQLYQTQAKAMIQSDTDYFNNKKMETEVPIFDNNQDLKEKQKSEILNLHKQGKNVMEIAKILEIGQGEVKLVIDLFQKSEGQGNNSL